MINFENIRIFIIEYIPWVLSTINIYAMIQVGNKKTSGWIISTSLQILWITWILCSKNWGFIPLNITMWIVSIRNWIKWSKGS